MLIPSFKSIYLFVDKKVPIQTTLQCLIRLLIFEEIRCTLVSESVVVLDEEGSQRTVRKHEFLAALREFQCSSSSGPMSHWNKRVFSSSVQCFAPCPPSKPSSSSVTVSLRRLTPSTRLEGCLRFKLGEDAASVLLLFTANVNVCEC